MTEGHDWPNGAVISVRNLGKVYDVDERPPGLGAAIGRLFRRRTRPVVAVAGISLAVETGEVVGFLGPNGAGKTTTLKLLAGLLHPTGGEIRVLGCTPYHRERRFLSQISLVMGNRRQLHWDLPVADSFEVHRVIYDLPREAYARRRAELVDLLELAPLLARPVRQLSLGERMRCELAVSLLHAPRVLFLDEPTIGLDVVAQRRIRAFLAAYNRRHQATILLTSHAMADVEALCHRVLLIDRGAILFDGSLAALRHRYAGHKTVAVQLPPGTAPGEIGPAALGESTEVVAAADGRVVLRVPAPQAATLVGRLVARLPVVDIAIADPPVDEVIERAFASRDGETRGAPGGPPSPDVPGQRHPGQRHG